MNSSIILLFCTLALLELVAAYEPPKEEKYYEEPPKDDYYAKDVCKDSEYLKQLTYTTAKHYKPTLEQCVSICCANPDHAYRERCFYQCEALKKQAEATYVEGGYYKEEPKKYFRHSGIRHATYEEPKKETYYETPKEETYYEEPPKDDYYGKDVCKDEGYLKQLTHTTAKHYKPTLEQCVSICCANPDHAYRERCFYQCEALKKQAEATYVEGGYYKEEPKKYFRHSAIRHAAYEEPKKETYYEAPKEQTYYEEPPKDDYYGKDVCKDEAYLKQLTHTTAKHYKPTLEQCVSICCANPDYKYRERCFYQCEALKKQAEATYVEGGYYKEEPKKYFRHSAIRHAAYEEPKKETYYEEPPKDEYYGKDVCKDDAYLKQLTHTTAKHYKPTLEQCVSICCANPDHKYRERCFYQCEALKKQAEATYVEGGYYKEEPKKYFRHAAIRHVAYEEPKKETYYEAPKQETYYEEPAKNDNYGKDVCKDDASLKQLTYTTAKHYKPTLEQCVSICCANPDFKYRERCFYQCEALKKQAEATYHEGGYY